MIKTSKLQATLVTLLPNLKKVLSVEIILETTTQTNFSKSRKISIPSPVIFMSQAYLEWQRGEVTPAL